MAKKTEQISVRMDPALYRTLTEIERRHGLPPTEMARRALEEIAAFYKQHGWFSFPARIEPKEKLLRDALARIERPADNLDVWKLDPSKPYVLQGDALVSGLMTQLRVPNLFAQAVEHDQVHTLVAFDNHPTHWVVLHLWKGHGEPGGNGLLFEAQPKCDLPRAQMLRKLRDQAGEMEANSEVKFSQIPGQIGDQDPKLGHSKRMQPASH